MNRTCLLFSLCQPLCKTSFGRISAKSLPLPRLVSRRSLCSGLSSAAAPAFDIELDEMLGKLGQDSNNFFSTERADMRSIARPQPPSTAARGSSSCFVRKPLQTYARSEEIDHSGTLSNHIYRILLLLAGELQGNEALLKIRTVTLCKLSLSNWKPRDKRNGLFISSIK